MDTNQAPGIDDLKKVADNPSGLFLSPDRFYLVVVDLNLDLSLNLVLQLWISISNLS